MMSDYNRKNEFVLDCFRQLLDDGKPHRYREIIDYVREQAKAENDDVTGLTTFTLKQTAADGKTSKDVVYQSETKYEGNNRRCLPGKPLQRGPG